MLEGGGLAFDIQKYSKFQKSNMVVLKLVKIVIIVYFEVLIGF